MYVYVHIYIYLHVYYVCSDSCVETKRARDSNCKRGTFRIGQRNFNADICSELSPNVATVTLQIHRRFDCNSPHNVTVSCALYQPKACYKKPLAHGACQKISCANKKRIIHRHRKYKTGIDIFNYNYYISFPIWCMYLIQRGFIDSRIRINSLDFKRKPRIIEVCILKFRRRQSLYEMHETHARWLT